jgi:hypothetical protein
MSLSTDRFFFKALTSDSNVAAAVGTRIANPALTYEQEDKWSLPYLVIMLEGVVNQPETKDERGESDDDTANVSILCVASTRDALSALTETVRTAVRDAYREEQDWDAMGFEIKDYQFSAENVQLDPDKPCVFQTLRYACDVQNLELIWE